MACDFQIANPVGNVGEFNSIGNGYGWRVHPITGENQFHLGIDIPAAMYTNVRSIGDGIIVRQGNGERAGNYIVVKHNNGYESKYMHLSNILTAKGDLVTAGTIIGTIGQTGSATGPHLHFEMWDQNGDNINPTDCYNNSIHVIPYNIPPGESLVPTETDDKKIWPWLLGGFIVLGVGIGIAVAVSDKNKT